MRFRTIYSTQIWSQRTIQRCSEINTRSHKQTNAAPRSTHDLRGTDRDAFGIDTILGQTGMISLVRRPEESNDIQITKISYPTPLQSPNNISRTKRSREKARTNNFNEVRQLAYVLRTEERISYSNNKLQGLQFDMKIQIRKTAHSVIEFSQTN